MNSIDKQIMDLFWEISPSSAFTSGFEQYAGKVFVPSSENLEKARRNVERLKKDAGDEMQQKLLDSIDTMLSFEEPQPVLDEIVGSIYAHLVKEGINKDHMLSLLSFSQKALDKTLERFKGKELAVGVKVLTLYRLESANGILDAIINETRSVQLKEECINLKAKVKGFVSEFALEGFGSGEFEKVINIFEKEGFSLGRAKFYERALREGLDYLESAGELESKAIAWIDEELPLFRDITEILSRKLDCSIDPLEVEKRINSRFDLAKVGLVKTTLSLRKILKKLVSKEICKITEKYRTKVVETPSYLTPTIPTGAASFFDTFTKRPFNIFFQTTDPKRDPDRSISFLLNLIVHEEYGHCVHHSNSCSGIPRRVREISMLPAICSAPISEGLSFNRELEFFNLSKEIESKVKLDQTEKSYVRFLERYGGLELINMELEFATRRWRLVRFLRVVGDVRINTEKQDIISFVEWAEKYTGIPRSSVYFQLLPAHEGIFPGYATSYAVIGQDILGLMSKIDDEKRTYKFSTYLCSIGMPPRSIYTKMLKDFLDDIS